MKMNENTGLNSLIVYSSQRHVSYIDHILYVVEECLLNEGFYPIFLRDEIKSGEDYLEQIQRLIDDCILGVVILDGFRPNVIFEFGMLLSLKKCVLVLMSNDAKIAVKTFYEQVNNLNIRDSNLTNTQFERMYEPKIDIHHHLSDYDGKHIVFFDFSSVKEIKRKINSNLKKIEKCIETYIDKKHAEAQKLNNRNVLIKTDWDKVDYLIRDNRLNHALRILRNSWDQYKNSDNRIDFIYLNKLGDTLLKLGKSDEAIEIYNKACSINVGDFEKISVYYKLGLIYHDLSYYNQALNYLNKALIVAKEYGKWNYIANIYNKIGDIYLKDENLEKAQNRFREVDMVLSKSFKESKTISEKSSILETTKSIKLSQIAALEQYYKRINSNYRKKKKN